MAKQHESSFLYDIREGRLFRHTPHFAVGNAVVPAYIKDPPQAPLIQCINQHSDLVIDPLRNAQPFVNDEQ